MAEDKKRDTDHKTLNEEVRKQERSNTNDYAERFRRQDVTNTHPAPPNPNRDNGGSKKDD